MEKYEEFNSTSSKSSSNLKNMNPIRKQFVEEKPSNSISKLNKNDFKTFQSKEKEKVSTNSKYGGTTVYQNLDYKDSGRLSMNKLPSIKSPSNSSINNAKQSNTKEITADIEKNKNNLEVGIKNNSNNTNTNNQKPMKFNFKNVTSNKEIRLKDSKEKDNEESLSQDSIELDYEAPKDLTFQLLNNKYSNSLTVFLQYPTQTNNQKQVINYKEKLSLPNNIKSTNSNSVNSSNSSKNTKKVDSKDLFLNLTENNNQNEVFTFNVNKNNKSNKDYCILYKAYKNVPRCILDPNERNGLLRTTSFLKANLIWKLLKYPKMEPLIKKLNKFQRYNHFPCTWQLGRKDNLWRNYQEFFKIYGKEYFNYLPKTYILPENLEKFKKEVHPHYIKDENHSNINTKDNNLMVIDEENFINTNQDYNSNEEENKISSMEVNSNSNSNNEIKTKNQVKKQMYIIKPVASSRGRGIKLMTSIYSVPSKCLVSKYIENPLLINKKKFDLRLYIVITSFAPLKIYLYQEGLVRFCSEEYSDEVSNPHNKYVHLTNYTINKSSTHFDSKVSTTDECTGSKWSLAALRSYFEQSNMDYDKLFKDIHDIIVKTVITISDKTIQTTDKLISHENCLFELYGFDVLIDRNLKPWLMEVNLNPSLNCDTDLDLRIKSMLMTDIFTLIGLEPYSHLVDKDIFDKGVRKYNTLKTLNLEIKENNSDASFKSNNIEYIYPNVKHSLEICSDNESNDNTGVLSKIGNGDSKLNSKISNLKVTSSQKENKKELWNELNKEFVEISSSKDSIASSYKTKRERSKILII